MEPPSALPRGGRVPWQDLLLAVSLLTLWNPLTIAQVTVEPVPPSATEGKDVLLQVHNLPGDTRRFNWGVIIPGPAHSGRETVYPNGSLLFRNITLKDTGYYTLQIVDRNYEVAQVTGQVHYLQICSLLSKCFGDFLLSFYYWCLPVPPSATEGKDVLLQVHNLPGYTGRFNWFKGATTEENHRIVSYIVDTQKTISGPAHSGRETVYPNGSLLFRNITLNDTGVYTLQFINRNFEVVQVTGQVQPLAQPTLHASNTTVTEDDSVVLTGSTNNTGFSIGWLFNGRSLNTLTIRLVRKEDAGNYQCEVSNPGNSRKSDPVRLAVSCE
uniref:Ig-like domain-containing protein n=1 Tax=Neovison vison TaxID=452646 RepID=A0A8C7C9H9_NEOVI